MNVLKIFWSSCLIFSCLTHIFSEVFLSSTLISILQNLHRPCTTWWWIWWSSKSNLHFSHFLGIPAYCLPSVHPFPNADLGVILGGSNNWVEQGIVNESTSSLYFLGMSMWCSMHCTVQVLHVFPRHMFRKVQLHDVYTITLTIYGWRSRCTGRPDCSCWWGWSWHFSKKYKHEILPPSWDRPHHNAQPLCRP